MATAAMAGIAGQAAQTAMLESRKNDNTGSGGTTGVMNSGAARRAYAPLSSRVDGRDVVSLSAWVPQPFAAGFLESAANVADKISAHASLKRQENQELNEDNIYRAVVAMRLFQKNGGSLSENVWVSGLEQPSKAEMQEAYRRLTQRVVEVNSASNVDTARQLRLDLLDAFRNCDWNNFRLADSSAA